MNRAFKTLKMMWVRLFVPNLATKKFLRTLGVTKPGTAVVVLGETNLEASILSCTALSVGVGYIIARAATDFTGVF